MKKVLERIGMVICLLVVAAVLSALAASFWSSIGLFEALDNGQCPDWTAAYEVAEGMDWMHLEFTGGSTTQFVLAYQMQWLEVAGWHPPLVIPACSSQWHPPLAYGQ